MDLHPDLAEFIQSPAALLFERAEAIEEELATAVRLWKVLQETHVPWLLSGSRRQLAEIIAAGLPAPHVDTAGVVSSEPEWLAAHRKLQRILERVSALRREGPLHVAPGVAKLEFRRAADRTLADGSRPYRGVGGDIDPDVMEDLMVGQAAVLCIRGVSLARGLTPPHLPSDRKKIVSRWFTAAEQLGGPLEVEGSAALAAGVGEPGSAFDVMVDALRVAGLVLSRVSEAQVERGGWLREYREVTAGLQVEMGVEPWVVAVPNSW